MQSILLAALTAATVSAATIENTKSAAEMDMARLCAPQSFHTAAADASAQTPSAALRKRLGGYAAAAHQGGLFGGTWPNTLTNFEHARSVGVDVVEMDLQTTSDGVVVIYHDDELSNLTDCTGTVGEKTYAQLRRCSFRLRWGAVIPTFDEVLTWANGRVVVDAEFKDYQSIAPALALTAQHGAHDWTYFQVQGKRDKYALAHAADRSAVLLYAVHNPEDLAWALSLHDDSLLIIEIDAPMRNAQTIAAIHAAGKLVTEDAWHFSSHVPYEVAVAACDDAYAWGIDIPVSNQAADCARQRDQYKRRKITELK